MDSGRLSSNRAGDGMLTVNQVAERLQISKQSVYGLIQRGQLATHRFGAGRGTIRISEADLAKFVEACRSQPATPLPRVQPAVSPRPTGLKHIRLSPK